MTEDDVSTRTPGSHRFCGEWLSRLRFEGPYTPFGTTPSLSMPGSMGGGDWGGVSFDPELGYIYVNTNNLGGVGHMAPSAAGAPMPYHNEGGYTRFIDEDQYPCQQPPWGQLSAVNADTGEVVWQRPLGSYDELEAQGVKNTGAPNMGGSIVTAGGLVFVAATTDSKFRAFDSRTGAELWTARLDASGTAVPMTYLGRDGTQYVVIASGGTNRFRMIANTAGKLSDALIAFSLTGKESGSAPPMGRSSGSPETPAAALQAAPGRAGAALPEGEGKATVVAICTKCHDAAVFTNAGMSREGWEAVVESMKENGAAGTDDQFKEVTDYLAKNFPSRR